MNNKNNSYVANIKKRRLEEIEQENKRIKRKMFLSAIKKGIISFIGAIIILAIVIVGKIGIAYEDDISNLFKNAGAKVEGATKETFNSKQPTKVYDKNGKVIFEYKQ